MDHQKLPNEEEEKKVPWWTSCRFGLAIIGFFGFVHLYAQRVGMSVAIVSMVNQTAVAMMTEANNNGLNISETMSSPNYTNGHAEELQCNDPQFSDNGKSAVPDGEFSWPKSIQGHVLGSFFYGYLVSQVPAGMLAERYGGKWVMAIFFGMTTLATLFTPLAARIGDFPFIIVLRVIAGIGSGAAYPAMHAIWSQWAPPNERSKLTNLTYAGSWMGNVIALPLAGVLCTYGFDGGWPSVFYIFGISSVVWIIVWCILVSDAPIKHPRITTVEKDYITNSLKGQISADGNKTEKMPWLKLLTSLPVWAVIMGVVTTDWGLYTFFTNTPTYLYEVLKFDVTSNGLYSALPFLGLWINMNISPVVADKLISTKTLSIGMTRKVMQGVGSVGAAIFIVGLAFMDCRHPLIAVGLLTTGITITGCVYSGWMVNAMDIAPRYAGTILGLANGLAASTGFIAPYTVAALTPNRTAEQWRRVFFVSGAIYVVGAIFFAIFSSGEIQDWAKDDEDADEEEKQELKDMTASPASAETEPV